MNGRQVMVTGASGFIGSHLTEALLKNGDEVHAFDHIPLERARNLDSVAKHPGLHYFEGDIRNREALEKYYVAQADSIYHLASVVGIRNYLSDPLGLIDVVVGGTRALLELARKHGTRFIFSSTSEIYGKNPEIPWREDSDRVLGPTSVDRWSYSSSKAVCEHMIYGIHRQCGLPFSVVRFFNVYGPRQNAFFVVSQSIHMALRGEQPVCYDDGTQTRCFTYIDDIVRGLLDVKRSPEAEGEAFNLGNTVESTIREVVELVCKAVGGGVSYRWFDTGKELGRTYEDVHRRVPDTSRAKALLGWAASTQLEEGVAKTVDWARANPWWLADVERAGGL